MSRPSLITTRLTVDLAKASYDICIGQGILNDAFGLLDGLVDPREPVAMVTDETVWALHGAGLAATLLEQGLNVTPVVMPPGEQSKSMEGLETLFAAFSDMQINRSSLILAFGGGVIGDLAGFAAASYLRGVPYVQIPTTLLAQVDASVGGKTAINWRQAKNQIGAFYQPRLVLIDTDTLDTLPARELHSGLAEVVKYAAIRSKSLFSELQANTDRLDLPSVIAQCCQIKAGLVEIDELDLGDRMLLNFGHTFGHAIEQAGSLSQVRHGEAVGMGMVIAARIGEHMELTRQGTSDSLGMLLSAYELPTRSPWAPAKLMPLLASDKKSKAQSIQMVLLREVGDAFVQQISIADLSRAIDEME
ncbi:MAG: 3-dehydroquinate synthase [Coriobacteriia bacterium]|nr:3-dehydroquinate synthase [Coriobacteriia bacterium]